MKYFKLTALMIFLVSFTVLFNSCSNSTSTSTDPTIDNINPNTGFPGDVVVISGSNFGEYDQNTSRVYFGTLIAGIKVDGTTIQWANDEISVIVPDGATSCDVYVSVNGKQSNKVSFTIPSAEPATNLMATSQDSKSVALKWTKSTDDGKTGFVGYMLVTINTTLSTKDTSMINAGVEKYTKTGLDEGTVYTFDLYAIKSATISGISKNVPSSKVEVQWSPASRFVEDFDQGPIRIYESSSTQFGSGLQLYNLSDKTPKNLMIDQRQSWDVGIYTKDGTLTFGPAQPILTLYNSSYGSDALDVEMMTDAPYEVDSLSEVFGSQALNLGHNFSTSTKVDLSQYNTAKNLVFIIRTNGPSWNYAKVMISNNGSNGFLQGTGTNHYIEVHVSYQITPGVPYSL